MLLPPSPDMVTSKSSISASTLFFREGDDFWFQARYYIEKGQPLTIVDLESAYFLGHMGPRLIVRNKALSVENKFADKINYNQILDPALDFPIGQWVKVKVHMNYDASDGIIQVWQDDELIIDAKGQNMPFDFWIQNILEIGISATQEETILLVDDVQFGQTDFN